VHRGRLCAGAVVGGGGLDAQPGHRHRPLHRHGQPLASDPAIQAAITDQITAQVFTYLDIQGLTSQAVEALAGRGLPPRLVTQLDALAVPIANGVQSFTRGQVAKVVQSDAFAGAWVQANRVAHAELVAALTGEGGGSITVENDTVSINLAAFIQTVKARLVDAGFTVAARIPEVNASFVLFQSADVTRARSAFNLLNTLDTWLPILALALLIALAVIELLGRPGPRTVAVPGMASAGTERSDGR
jgi:hypothetical protein